MGTSSPSFSFKFRLVFSTNQMWKTKHSLENSFWRQSKLGLHNIFEYLNENKLDALKSWFIMAVPPWRHISTPNISPYILHTNLNWILKWRNLFVCTVFVTWQIFHITKIGECQGFLYNGDTAHRTQWFENSVKLTKLNSSIRNQFLDKLVILSKLNRHINPTDIIIMVFPQWNILTRGNNDK